MKPFVYYSRGTNHQKSDDVAVAYAKSVKDAVKKFSLYYTSVSAKQVVRADIETVGIQKKDILIISGY